MKSIIIIGASGHGRVLFDILSLNKDINIVGFVDDNKTGTCMDLPILGTLSALLDGSIKKPDAVAIGVGDNDHRANIYFKLKEHHHSIVSAIHPSAIISRTAKLGEGVTICAGSIVCVNAHIGNNTILNTACSIDHDSVVEDHVHISPHAAIAGECTIGASSWIGIGANIIQQISIGAHTIVGGGSTVINNLDAKIIAVGSPARIIKTRTL